MKRSLESNRIVDGRVSIDDAFWNPRLKTLFEVTLKDTFDKFEKDGVIKNFEYVIENQQGKHLSNPWQNALLWASIRGAADYIKRGECSDALIERIDSYVDLTERAQLAAGGGYLSIHTILMRPQQRYGENGGNLLRQHDLYNQGSLIEAGVHYYQATGKVKLLECALRCVNEMCDTIGLPPKKWIVPGHSLIEYAVLELYELIRDEPELSQKVAVPLRTDDYLELVHFWIHGRGRHEHRTNHPRYMGEYAQDHAPIEQQVQAVGHAVRAVLYYTGATRLAMVEGDEDLLGHSIRLWENVTENKMHVNGGIGATHYEEKFGEDYDLHNTGYLETCATAGLIFWAEALSRATGDARYFQIVERGLYNLMLSSVSLQGESYFYRNPLTSDGSDHHWTWHSCPCCPTMIHKTFGMLDKLIYAQSDDALLINLYIGGRARMRYEWGEVEIEAETGLPWNGCYTVAVKKASRAFELKVRIPDWATDIEFTLNGNRVQPETKDGYAVFKANAGDVIGFTEPLIPRRIEAHPYVRADRDRVAISRGQLIYCLEGVDNNGEVDITVGKSPEFKAEYRPELLGGISVITGKTDEDRDFVAVPLCVWDNRMAGKMNVWLRQEGKQDSWSTSGWEKKLYRTYDPAK